MRQKYSRPCSASLFQPSSIRQSCLDMLLWVVCHRYACVFFFPLCVAVLRLCVYWCCWHSCSSHPRLPAGFPPVLVPAAPGKKRSSKFLIFVCAEVKPSTSRPFTSFHRYFTRQPRPHPNDHRPLTHIYTSSNCPKMMPVYPCTSARGLVPVTCNKHAVTLGRCSVRCKVDASVRIIAPSLSCLDNWNILTALWISHCPTHAKVIKKKSVSCVCCAPKSDNKGYVWPLSSTKLGVFFTDAPGRGSRCHTYIMTNAAVAQSCDQLVAVRTAFVIRRVKQPETRRKRSEGRSPVWTYPSFGWTFVGALPRVVVATPEWC